MIIDRQNSLETILCRQIPVQARLGIGSDKIEVKRIKCLIPFQVGDRVLQNRITSLLINGGRGYWKESIEIVNETQILLNLAVVPEIVDQATEDNFVSRYITEISKLSAY